MNLQYRLNLLADLGMIFSQMKHQFVKGQVHIDEHVVNCERDEVFEKEYQRVKKELRK